MEMVQFRLHGSNAKVVSGVCKVWWCFLMGISGLLHPPDYLQVEYFCNRQPNEKLNAIEAKAGTRGKSVNGFYAFKKKVNTNTNRSLR